MPEGPLPEVEVGESSGPHLRRRDRLRGALPDRTATSVVLACYLTKSKGGLLRCWLGKLAGCPNPEGCLVYGIRLADPDSRLADPNSRLTDHDSRLADPDSRLADPESVPANAYIRLAGSDSR